MEPPSLNFPDTGTFLLHNAFVPECCLLQLQHYEDESEDEEDEQGSLGSGGGQGFRRTKIYFRPVVGSPSMVSVSKVKTSK